MRNNLPVTQREYDFPQNETLLSTTDPSSHITYANSAFIRTSGYDNEELIGEPHNLVRHPDMPAEAFRDMWRTLKEGHAWTALVKNRRKDGDHYWVRANASPMVRNGRLTGYLSVRTRPSRQEIQAASELYKKFKDGQAGGLAFHRGLIVKSGVFGFTRALQTMPVAWRVRLGMLTSFSLAAAGLSMTSLGGLELFGALSALFTGAVAANVFIETQVTAPLGKILAAAERVASGERAQIEPYNRCDEIGSLALAVNQAGLNLQSLVADVYSRTHAVSGAASQIAAANHDLAARTEEAASSLERIAATMAEQTQAVQQNSKNAHEARNIAEQTANATQNCGQLVNDVISTMSSITRSSERISEIISVIDGIAFQTNILALNAAVEAARAGEAGRGFAVVAAEVRALAQKSAGAAKEIKHLIETSVGEVEKGSHLVENAGQHIRSVVDMVHRVSDMVASISSASQQQASGIGEIGTAISTLDQMTHQNATLVEETATAADSLSEQAQRLEAAIQVFSS